LDLGPELAGYALDLWLNLAIFEKTATVYLVLGFPILSCKMPQCIQEKAKSSESALDKGIPKGCWKRACR